MERPIMSPAAGERLVRYVGDTVRFRLDHPQASAWAEAGWQARLRTNLGRAAVIRSEVIDSKFKQVPLAGASWRDIPMSRDARGWQLTLPLTEVGYFQSKPYAIDPHGRQHWPEGDDAGISVHPDGYRTANTIYCAFPRMFGASRALVTTADPAREAQLKLLDEGGYTVIPPSGKLRDVVRELPHIFEKLGCRILHLLPVNPTPTVMARFGRFGSPYAAQDLAGIDPSLVDFDRRTTGVEQFEELTSAVHARGGRVFLDIVINHTGWGAWLQESHPEWFLRHAEGAFASPGAWGVVWEDLVELAHRDASLWEHLAGVFLTWCRRGVDGFRCDAGYKVPLPAWQHIIARVRQEFPETLFLLEGLGGGWNDTAALLTAGGMQWAYSELFQELSGVQVANYLDHALKQSPRTGTLIHYSETHDNERLAKKGRVWSVLRNRLCALTSVSGGFGFTCGVEWLATEQIQVHACRGLSWGSPENLVDELQRLTGLLSEHPAFFDGAQLTRLSTTDSPVYALRRQSRDGPEVVLVLVNNDVTSPQEVSLNAREWDSLGSPTVDLLAEPPPEIRRVRDEVMVRLAPAAGHCLTAHATPRGETGAAYRRLRAQAAWAITALARVLPIEVIGEVDWRKLARLADAAPARFLTAAQQLATKTVPSQVISGLELLLGEVAYPTVVEWWPEDRARALPVAASHWLLVRDTVPFRATLRASVGAPAEHRESVPLGGGHAAWFAPRPARSEASLEVERFAEVAERIQGLVTFLSAEPCLDVQDSTAGENGLVLLTNGIGGMARMRVDLGAVASKYDCVLGANLHASLPVDRHVLVKRLRLWVNADGFLTPLNAGNLIAFTPGPPAVWTFVANAGDGRSIELQLTADMVPGRNTTVFRITRPTQAPALGIDLGAGFSVTITARFDLEDRNFHWETKRHDGADTQFTTHTHPLQGRPGFAFVPASERSLTVWSDGGRFHREPEWSVHLSHAVEASRGMAGSGDAWSPGWFELPLRKGESLTLAASAERDDELGLTRFQFSDPDAGSGRGAERDEFSTQLDRAIRAFVVRRGTGRTVIAGYPWFLDWGRDTLICARGMLAAGRADEVREILSVFGRFEDRGTLPNTIHGEDASNRDTSDAPLWYGVVCEEAAEAMPSLYATSVVAGGRTVAEVLRAIATGYVAGTPNGICMDAASALIWSPAHFTWMDTNHPAATPREGFPVEIQVLWIRLLKQLARLGVDSGREAWSELAARAEQSFHRRFWLEECGWYSDVLLAGAGTPAERATADRALRSNQLFAISLELATGDRAQRSVAAVARHLLIPGAVRSLAPLPVTPPLRVVGRDGRLLNDPDRPYFGRYEGDEDTRRKPAYHNGTAWVWTLPVFCEALARAWDGRPEAVAAARSYLGSVDQLWSAGCLGQLPEILDGDFPHQQRGCDAQAWSVTETFRVWRFLNESRRPMKT